VRAGWAWLTCRGRLTVAEAAYRSGDLGAAVAKIAAAQAQADAGGWPREQAWASLLQAGLCRARGERDRAAQLLVAIERSQVVDAPFIEAARVAHAALAGDVAAHESFGALLARRLGLGEPSTLLLREANESYWLSERQSREWSGERYALLVDLAHCRVKIGRRWADLSKTEALVNVLRALAQTPGAPVSIDTLVRDAWGTSYHPLRHRSRVGMAIMRLRRLLGARTIAARNDGYALVTAGAWAVIEPVRAPDMNAQDPGYRPGTAGSSKT
jgi:hypothetical protein